MKKFKTKTSPTLPLSSSVILSIFKHTAGLKANRSSGGISYDMPPDERFAFKPAVCLKIDNITDDDNGRVGDVLVLNFFMDVLKRSFNAPLPPPRPPLNDEYGNGRGFSVLRKQISKPKHHHPCHYRHR